MTTLPILHRGRRTVQFADTDAAGVVHFARLLCYVEEAEHAYLSRLGYSVAPHEKEALQWPRSACSAEFLRPVLPFQEVEVALGVNTLGSSTIAWEWEMTVEGKAVAKGGVTTVCCRWHEDRLCRVPLPDELRRALSA